MVINTTSKSFKHEDASTENLLQRKILQKMLLIRKVEEEIVHRYGNIGKEQEIRCPVHLSIGQEAAAVGACCHLEREDVIFSTHRCHAHYLAKGGNLLRMVLELYGKQGGCLDGRGGSMHLMDPEAGVAMSVPIVSSAIPLAVGQGLSHKIDNNKKVTVTFFGDASVEEGVFHESMNFASLHRIPVIFVCENNLFSVYTHISQRQPNRPLEHLGLAHQMPTITLDGNDVFQIAESFKKIIEQTRNEHQPQFVILNTYRFKEHCGINLDNHLGYRDEQEFFAWQKKDPLDLAIKNALEQSMMSSQDIDDMKDQINKEVDQAFNQAEKALLPSSDMASKYIYA